MSPQAEKKSQTLADLASFFDEKGISLPPLPTSSEDVSYLSDLVSFCKELARQNGIKDELENHLNNVAENRLKDAKKTDPPKDACAKEAREPLIKKCEAILHGLVSEGHSFEFPGFDMIFPFYPQLSGMADNEFKDFFTRLQDYERKVYNSASEDVLDDVMARVSALPLNRLAEICNNNRQTAVQMKAMTIGGWKRQDRAFVHQLRECLPEAKKDKVSSKFRFAPMKLSSRDYKPGSNVSHPNPQRRKNPMQNSEANAVTSREEQIAELEKKLAAQEKAFSQKLAEAEKNRKGAQSTPPAGPPIPDLEQRFEELQQKIEVALKANTEPTPSPAPAEPPAPSLTEDRIKALIQDAVASKLREGLETVSKQEEKERGKLNHVYKWHKYALGTAVLAIVLAGIAIFAGWRAKNGNGSAAADKPVASQPQFSEAFDIAPLEKFAD